MSTELIRTEVRKLPALGKLNPQPHWFESRLEDGKCLVILDGLDEVTNDTDRATVSQWVKQQMENYSKSTFILTSRPYGYEHELFSGQIDVVLEIQPFTLVDMKRFIENWYKQTEISQQGRNTPAVRQEAQNKADDLYEALLQNPAIRKMASNPLLVTMIATVHYLGNALPGRRVELYREICDVLLGKRLLARKMQLPLNAEQNQSILQAIALYLMQQGTQKFTLAETDSLIQNKLNQVPNNSLTSQNWLETMRDDVGLLVEKELNSYEFSHLSFQEYLAAAEIKTQKQEELLLQKFNQIQWAETIRLYAAQSNATQLIQVALKQPTVHSLSLAYDCLEESPEIHPEVAESLRNRLETGLEDPEPKIAQLAAQVKLSRRLNKLLQIDENLDIDRTFITCAEYQLYIDSITEEKLIYPNH